MTSNARQGDSLTDFAPDPVHGFAYCRELPPDVPPGMTLDDWRRATIAVAAITVRSAATCSLPDGGEAPSAATVVRSTPSRRRELERGLLQVELVGELMAQAGTLPS
jgi:hypothetical protein